ncbi:MAG: 3-hydroxyacyl-ACP dehydratase FabZ [Aerococcus sp.]|nr:3-hydroxyacyl-ACP dehydratase FabZ [Aerococcus sp.]
MGVMEAEDIMSLIPNHYPVLFVDRVDELTPDASIRCTKNVTVNEEYFQGHFPGTPVMPGVLIIESLVQAALILILKSAATPAKPTTLRSVDKAKFRHLVKPGDTLILNVNVISWQDDSARVKCEATVDDDLACSAVLTFAIPA